MQKHPVDLLHGNPAYRPARHDALIVYIFITQGIDVGCSFVRMKFLNVAAFLLQYRPPVFHDDLFFFSFSFKSFKMFLPDHNFLFFFFTCFINHFFIQFRKLFTKFNGFCISYAIPAVSSPRLAIFFGLISWA